MRPLAIAFIGALAVSCGGGDDGSSATTDEVLDSVAAAERCVVQLHPKGADGTETTIEDGVTFIAPRGNAEGWGGRQWLYFPEDRYAEARAVIATAIEPCARAVIDGFSNGASFAAKLYCKGETFGGRVVGVVVDDPVVDGAVDGCAPAPDVELTLYWTGALTQAVAGWDCTEQDWTCEGGATIGLDAYAAALGVAPTPSPFDDHQWYVDAPELSDW